jgi:PKD repeat protein
VIFYAYYSEDYDGYIVGYQWDFENDGHYETGWLEDLLITHKFTTPGNKTIRLQVKDDDGAITTSEPFVIRIIELDEALQLPLPVTNGPFYAYTNDVIRLSSDGTHDPDGVIVNYTWNFGDGNKSYLENPNHSYAESGNYTIILTVVDNDNLSNSVSTKAIIIDERERPPPEDEQPLMLILFIIMAIVATIVIMIIRSKTYNFTVLVEKKDKKRKEDINSKVDRELEKHTKLESKVDKVLSDLDKKNPR